MTKTILAGICALLVMVSAAQAERIVPRADVQYTASGEPLPPLPRRFQNHCGWKWGHFYCANHCGIDYQLYYCTPSSFGCCHVGHGYCGSGGLLRCRP